MQQREDVSAGPLDGRRTAGRNVIFSGLNQDLKATAIFYC
jgi:hypothetical protein